jgi:digeranylgeranylglycerophospholipid reductase
LGTIHDVVVVGAGPSGSYTAYQLARDGFDVVVLEKNGTSTQPPVCAGVLGTEAFEHFDLPRDSILSSVKDLRFISPSGQRILFRPHEVQAHVVDRMKFNEGLRELARQHGASIREETACTAIKITDSHVDLKLSHNGDSLQAKAVVLACGFNPELTRSAGLGTIGSCVDGAQAEVQMKDFSATEIYVGRNVAPSSFGWAVMLNDGRARVGVVTKARAPHFLEKLLTGELLRDRIKSKGRVLRKLIPCGRLERSYGKRTLAVGEVAGQVKTTTHGGIYYGLIGARAAAETLKRALRLNDLGARALQEYEKKWRSQLEPELQRGLLLRKFFERLSDGQIDTLFSLASKDSLMELVQKKARFDWHGELIASVMEHTLLRRFRIGL